MADVEYKIALIGAGNVGKSSITIQFLQDIFVHEYDPTIEDWYRKVFEFGTKKCMLSILDTAGEEEYYVMWDKYFKECQGFLVIFDITNAKSLNIDFYLEKIFQTKQKPAVFVGNKCDLEDLR